MAKEPIQQKSAQITTLEKELDLAEQESNLSVVSSASGISTDQTYWTKKRMEDTAALKQIKESRMQQKAILLQNDSSNSNNKENSRENKTNHTSFQQSVQQCMSSIDEMKQQTKEFHQMAMQFMQQFMPNPWWHYDIIECHPLLLLLVSIWFVAKHLFYEGSTVLRATAKEDLMDDDRADEG